MTEDHRSLPPNALQRFQGLHEFGETRLATEMKF